MRFPFSGPRRAGAMLAMVACLAVGITGCGSDDDDSGTTSAATDSSAPAADVASDRTEAAKTAAIADAEKAGGKVDAPTGKTIGFMYLSKSTEASIRLHDGLKAAADLFGFKVVTCDPNFDPAKTAQCMTTLVSQSPDLILTSAAATSALGGGLKSAADRDIPVVMIGALQAPSPYYTAQYVPDEKRLSKALNEWMFGLVNERVGDGPATIAAFQAPNVGQGVIDRDVQRKADLEAFPNIKQVTHDIDLGDAVQDTRSRTRSLVQQNSDLQALWQTCDFCAPPMAQALDQLGLQGDDRPFTGAFYTTKQSREMIKAGKLSGAVEVNYGVQSWVSLDQALQNWARETPFAETNAVFQDGYGIEMLEPWIVTQENVGDPAVVRNQAEDYETYFRTKWNAEFGVGSAP